MVAHTSYMLIQGSHLASHETVGDIVQYAVCDDLYNFHEALHESSHGIVHISIKCMYYDLTMENV